MTKIEFIRARANEAVEAGVYNMELARALANVIDSLEQDLKQGSEAVAKLKELKEANDAAKGAEKAAKARSSKK